MPPRTYPHDLEKQIEEAAYYSTESLRALCLIAREIRRVKDRPTRDYLRWKFEQAHGRKVTVWARVPVRFAEYFDRENAIYAQATADSIKALTYLCQLKEKDCTELYIEFARIICEPNVHLTVMAKVNARKTELAGGREKKPTLAERDAERVLKWKAPFNNPADLRIMPLELAYAVDELSADPDVAHVLASKAKESDERTP
jgi:hypothetical protein